MHDIFAENILDRHMSLIFVNRANLPGGQKSGTRFNFAITSVNVHRFLPFFAIRTRNLWRLKVRLRLPPHLYSVTTLSSKTHTSELMYNIDVFGMCNISKFTQNSLVLIPYFLHCWQQFLDEFWWEFLTVELLKRTIIT